MVRFMKRKLHMRWPNLSFAISDHLEVSARPNTSVEPDTEAASPYNDRHRQQSRRNAKQNRKSLRGKSQTCVFQSFLFPSRGTPRVEKHHAPTAAIKGVGFRKTRLFVGQPREKWSCCHYQSNDDLRSSACPSQSDFDTRLS